VKENILVVDDDPSFRRVVDFTLKEEGYEPTLAANGREARELFDGGDFSAVITDVLMPEVSGLELLRELRAIAPEVPVLGGPAPIGLPWRPGRRRRTCVRLGKAGPERARPAMDPILQAFTGLIATNRGPDGIPHRVQPIVVDMSTALYTFQAIATKRSAVALHAPPTRIAQPPSSPAMAKIGLRCDGRRRRQRIQSDMVVLGAPRCRRSAHHARISPTEKEKTIDRRRKANPQDSPASKLLKKRPLLGSGPMGPRAQLRSRPACPRKQKQRGGEHVRARGPHRPRPLATNASVRQQSASGRA